MEDVPHAVGLRFAGTFGEGAVDAVLLALAINPDAHLGGRALGDELIGGEAGVLGGELVVTVL